MCVFVCILTAVASLALRTPDDFAQLMNRGTLPAMRTLIALQRLAPDHVCAASRELWRRVWSANQNITEESSIVEALRVGQTWDVHCAGAYCDPYAMLSTAGVPETIVVKALAQRDTPNNKAALKATTVSTWQVL